MRQEILILAVMAGVCGCTGPMFEGTVFGPPQQPRRAVQEVAPPPSQTDLACQQLNDQVEALNRSLGALEQRIARLEQQVAQVSRPNEEVAAMRRDLQRMRGDQEKMRQEIVSDLAGRIEKIAARQAAATAVPAPSRTPPPTARPVAAHPPATPARGAGYEHTVEKGQTLTEIARGYGTTVQAIMKANKLSNPSAIRVGQVLFVPDPER